MLLTTTAGTQVDVPVSLPDLKFSAYLPRQRLLLDFHCVPNKRDNPAEAEPDTLDVVVSSWERCHCPKREAGIHVAGCHVPTPIPYVSEADMDAEERERYAAWQGYVATGATEEERDLLRKSVPFRLLHPDDRDAVQEAAGDVLARVADALCLTPDGPLSFADFAEKEHTLRAIADMRAHELGAWEAWQRLPKRLHGLLVRPTNPAEWNVDRWPSAATLARHLELLAEQAATWSRQQAEQHRDRREDAERKERAEVAEGNATDRAVDRWKDGR